MYGIAVAFCFGIMFAGFIHWLKDDDSMRHSWIIEHHNCQETDETRTILGTEERRWTCEKQDAFWRPIKE